MIGFFLRGAVRKRQGKGGVPDLSAVNFIYAVGKSGCRNSCFTQLKLELEQCCDEPAGNTQVITESEERGTGISNYTSAFSIIGAFGGFSFLKMPFCCSKAEQFIMKPVWAIQNAGKIYGNLIIEMSGRTGASTDFPLVSSCICPNFLFYGYGFHPLSAFWIPHLCPCSPNSCIVSFSRVFWLHSLLLLISPSSRLFLNFCVQAVLNASSLSHCEIHWLLDTQIGLRMWIELTATDVKDRWCFP